MQAIGDLASFMLSSRYQNDLRNVADLAAEVATTGLAKDKASHLGGSTMALSLLERKSVLLEQHQRGIAEAALFARSKQSILGQIQDQTAQLTQSLSLTSQLSNLSAIKTLSESASVVLVDTINALNSKVAGRHVFSGSAIESKPLPDGSVFLDMLRSAVSGATGANDVTTSLDIWFDTPGGGFEFIAYSGSTASYMKLPLSDGETARFGLRADDETLRGLLKSMAKAALAAEPVLGLSLSDQQGLMSQGRGDLLGADQKLTEERASVGLTEAIIENARLSAESDLAKLSMDRLALIGVDQFEAATQFEAAQQQLDVFYRIAARQGQTSLAEYLR